MVVGDDDQSDLQVPRRRLPEPACGSRRRSPRRRSIVLDQNYRSTQRILDAANAVIANNAAHAHEAPVDRAGRRRADRAATRARTSTTRPRSSCARSTASSTAASTATATSPSSTAPTRRAACSKRRWCAAGVPYRVFGGVKFYDRREVKDALAYLRALVNPDDEVTWKRIVNTPRRGVGDTSVAKIDAYAQGAGSRSATRSSTRPRRGRHRQGARRAARPARADGRGRGGGRGRRRRRRSRRC